MLLSLVISTAAFFVASHVIKKWADENDMPRGATRSIVMFTASIFIAYGAAWVIDQVTAVSGALP